MLIPAAASILLTLILVSASPSSAQALNGPQITKPTAFAIPLRRSHGTNHTSNAHILQKDRERIRYRYGKQGRRAGLVAPKTGGAPPSKRDVMRSPRPFDIKAKRNGQSGAEPMIAAANRNGIDVAYYGTISVGTPSQETTVLFDTGSSDLVVPVTGCISQLNLEPCVGPLFDTFRSTTLRSSHTPFNIAYQDGSGAGGFVVRDTVTLAGLTVPQQNFAALSWTKGFSGPAAGMLGLGFPATSVSGSNPFFGNLAESGSLQSNVFSFYMAKDGDEGSELCLGCVNSEKFQGEFNYHPIVSFTADGQPVHWDIECGGISYSNAESSSPWKSGRFTATIDSGAAFISVSLQVAQELYGQIPNSHPASEDWGDGAHAFPCDSVNDMGKLSLDLGGYQYDIKWRDLIAGPETEDSDQCVGAIFGHGDQDDDTVVLGLSFMKTVYSVFDYQEQEIGFAELG